MDMFYYDCTVTLIDATKCPTTLVGFSDEEANKDGSKLNFNANGCIGLKSISLDVPINSINLSGCTSIAELQFYSACSLTTLDVSTCTALTVLECSGNKLTTLDISKCIVLEELHCSNNQFSETAMNNIYNALPNWTGKEAGYISISAPYGNYSITENKNWRVVK